MFTKRMIPTAVAWLAMPASLLAADLKVEIRGMSSVEGTVNIALFDGPGQFLAKPVASLKISAKERPLIAVFANLKPGTYAISTFHDANANGALDKNLLGLPTEKYGFSRDAARRMGPPSFEDAAFAIDSDQQAITINLR
jgi:uncharacterized protein (DUF2141 family)